MVKAWNFNKNRPSHRYYNNNLQKVFWRNIIEDATEHKLLIVNLIVHLFSNGDANFTRCQRDASVQIIKPVFHLPSETYSGLSQASKMDHFERIVDAC